jgi:hypothetical protein
VEPLPKEVDPLEEAADQAIAVCGGDVRAALKAALVANSFYEREIERLIRAVSTGYTRGRAASKKVNDWREIAAGKLSEAE